MLTGPVGAGKTTVARELVATAQGFCAHIEGDAFWPFIKKTKPERRGEDSRMIMRAMTASARHFERDGYEVILDFTIPPWYLDAMKALLPGKSFDYVVLKPSEAVCAARAKARAEGRIADYAVYHDLYGLFDALPSHAVGDDTSDPASTAALIRKRLAAGDFRLG